MQQNALVYGNDLVSWCGAEFSDVLEYVEKDLDKYYCIPCKLTVCSNCDLEHHKKHTIIQKKEYELNEENIRSEDNSA